MNTFVFVALTYAIAFGLQNKVDFLRGKSAFTDRLLSCIYCTGFHAGWLSWLLLHASPQGFQDAAASWGSAGISVASYALVGAGSSYVIDAVVRWFEGNTPVSDSE